VGLVVILTHEWFVSGWVVVANYQWFVSVNK